MIRTVPAFLLALVACGHPRSSSPGPDNLVPGMTRREFTDPARLNWAGTAARLVTTLIWYPVRGVEFLRAQLASLPKSSLPAQALSPDSLFPRLIGKWVLRGTIARQQTTHDVTFEWLLGRGYVQMHEVSRERGLDGKPAYEAVVLFGRDPRSGEYACLWLDNTGTSAFDPAGTGRGFVSGDSIPFLFTYTATTSFHTTFIYDRANDSWRWDMDNDSAGVRRPFARVVLTRAPR